MSQTSTQTTSVQSRSASLIPRDHQPIPGMDHGLGGLHMRDLARSTAQMAIGEGTASATPTRIDSASAASSTGTETASAETSTGIEAASEATSTGAETATATTQTIYVHEYFKPSLTAILADHGTLTRTVELLLGRHRNVIDLQWRKRLTIAISSIYNSLGLCLLAGKDEWMDEVPDLEFQERVITACELGKTLFKKVETSVDEAHANLEVTVGGTFNRMTMLREYFEKTTHISNSPNTQSGVKKAEEGGFQRCLASIEVLEEAFTSSESRSKSALDSMNEFELHITKFKDECLKARGKWRKGNESAVCRLSEKFKALRASMTTNREVTEQTSPYSGGSSSDEGLAKLLELLSSGSADTNSGPGAIYTILNWCIEKLLFVKKQLEDLSQYIGKLHNQVRHLSKYFTRFLKEAIANVDIEPSEKKLEDVSNRIVELHFRALFAHERSYGYVTISQAITPTGNDLIYNLQLPSIDQEDRISTFKRFMEELQIQVTNKAGSRTLQINFATRDEKGKCTLLKTISV